MFRGVILHIKCFLQMHIVKTQRDLGYVWNTVTERKKERMGGIKQKKGEIINPFILYKKISTVIYIFFLSSKHKQM